MGERILVSRRGLDAALLALSLVAFVASATVWLSTPSSTVAEPDLSPLARLAGAWDGYYDCSQGRTLVTVSIGNDLVGQFRFRPPSGRVGGSGSFEVRVVIDGDSINLYPVRWLEQPPGYVMVGAELRVIGADQLSGRITYPGCGEISLRRATREGG
jgi:hypothetical protein